MAFVPFYLVTFAAGVSVAVQQVLNSNLRGQIGSPWWAGVTNYVVGLAAMLVVAVSVDGVRGVGAMIGRVHGFYWVGGFLGALFIGTGILMVPRLGAATTLTFIILGQLVAAATMDHFGLLGLAQNALTPHRLLGIVLLVGGVMLVRN